MQFSKKDVTAKKIYKYFEDFFKLSIQYINDQKERVINRLDHDEDLKRYEMTDIRTLYPEGVNEIKQQLYSQYEYNPMYNYNAYFEKMLKKK